MSSILARLLAGIVGALVGGLVSLALAMLLGVGGLWSWLPIIVGLAVGAIFRDSGIRGLTAILRLF